MTGNDKATGRGKHDEGSLLPVHGRASADVRGYVRRLLGIRLIDLNLSPQQRQWTGLAEDRCQRRGLPPDRYLLARTPLFSSVLDSLELFFKLKF